MAALFEQTLILFIFILAGFGLARAGIIHGEHAKILSELLVYIILPCSCVETLSANFTIKYITEKYTLVLTSAVIIIVVGVVFHFVSKPFSKNKYEQIIYEYSLVMPNFGGVGFPMAQGILGAAGLLDAMVFAIPMYIYTYTYGYAALTKRTLNQKHFFSLKTLLMLANPVTISMFIGMIMGLTGLTLPNFCNVAIGKASACLAPIAMLIVGIVIADFDLKKLLKDKRTYVVVALRLLIQPLVIGGIMVLLGIKGAPLTATVMFLALPCGMNTITLPKLFDENCEIGASMALVSNVLACLTIPIVLALFGIGSTV